MNPTPLIIIVAATTQSLGIGRLGTLPWAGRLPKELGYFARVTKHTTTGARQNSLIMGRTTWRSIPPKRRPLGGRLNIVLSRKRDELEGGGGGGAHIAGSLTEALAIVDALGNGEGSKVFVVGGAQVYAAALEDPRTASVLLTRVHHEFECDAFFPVDVGAEGSGWVKRSHDELSAFVGEHVPEGVQEEDGIRYEFELYQRV